jgi:aspartate aminotransferase
MTAAMSSREKIISLLKELMDIQSTSEEEYDIGVFLEKYLQSLKYSVERVPISEGSSRHNVYAYLGPERKARTCLSSHMDTVPPYIAFRMEGDVIYGRGACDDKGPLVAQIQAVEEVRAVPAHSGYPERGQSANMAMIAALHELGAVRFPESDLLGPSTFHVGMISGGVGYNILSPQCTATIAVRVADNLPRVDELVQEVVARHPRVTATKRFDYPNTLLDHDVPGLETTAVSFGTDVPRLKGNHKKYLYGPGSILVAHGKDEQITVPELLEAVQVYKRLVRQALGK